MKFVLIMLPFIITVAIFLLPASALASVDAPDTLQIIQVNVYQNILEEDDQLYIATFNITYSGTPPANYDASDLFLCRLMNSGTQIAANAPWPYYNDGFASGITGFYFSSEDVSTLNMGWGDGTGYTIQLTGNPMISWSGGSAPTHTVSSFANWYSGSSFSETQTAIETRLRFISNQIEDDWGEDLIEGLAGESYLTAAGEEYFTHAIDYLRYLAPDLFQAGITQPSFDDTGYTRDYYLGGDDRNIEVYGTNYYAQTFVISRNYDIRAFEFKGSRTGTPTAITVELQSVSSGTPTGTVLSSGTLSATGMSTYTSGEWYEVVLSNAYDASSGTPYAIVFSNSSGDSSNLINIRIDSSGIYDNGMAFDSTDSGSTWNQIDSGTDDIIFGVKSDQGSSRNYIGRMEQRVIGTPLDMTEIAEEFNMTRLWFSSIIWFFVSIGAAVLVSRKSMSTNPVVLTIALTNIVGALIGMSSWTFAIVVAFICGLLIIVSFTYKQTQ